jgi:hypothetical protein
VLRASGATLLVPAGLLVALAVTTAVGDGNGLRGLGQLFAGPAVPPASARVAPASPGASASDESPAIPVRSGGVRRTNGSATGGGTRSGTRRSTAGRRIAVTTPDRRVPSQGPTRTLPKTPASQPATPSPTPAPAPAPSPIRAIGKVVTDTVKAVPVAGEPVAGVVQTVIDLVDPPPSPPPAAAPAPVSLPQQ